jgi:Flp pilus assembly protein TadD
LFKLTRLDDAVTTFEKAVALRPDDPRELRVLASIQLMDGKPKDALVTLQPLLDAQDADSETLQLASTAHEDAGETPQAVALLRQAMMLDPKNPGPYLDFADICFNHQSFQVGIDVITDGLSQQPNSDDLYVARGVLYVQLAQYDKA